MEGHLSTVAGLGFAVYSRVAVWLYTYKDKLLRGGTEFLFGGAPQMPRFGADIVFARHSGFKGVWSTQFLRNSNKPTRLVIKSIFSMNGFLVSPWDLVCSLYCSCRDPSWCVDSKSHDCFNPNHLPAEWKTGLRWSSAASWARSFWIRPLVSQLSLGFLHLCKNRQEIKLSQTPSMAWFTSRWAVFCKVPDATMEQWACLCAKKNHWQCPILSGKTHIFRIS